MDFFFITYDIDMYVILAVNNPVILIFLLYNKSENIFNLDQKVMLICGLNCLYNIL